MKIEINDLSLTVSPTDIICRVSKPGGVPARHWVGKTKDGNEVVLNVVGISIPENDSMVAELSKVLEIQPDPIIEFEK